MIYHRTPLIKIIIKYMGEYLCMSFIIRTFILSVVKTETCSGGISFAEGRLQPALIYYYRSPIFYNRILLSIIKLICIFIIMNFIDYILLSLVIIGGATGMSLLFVFICTIILKNYPTSNVSSYIRDHIITDVDLEG